MPEPRRRIKVPEPAPEPVPEPAPAVPPPPLEWRACDETLPARLLTTLETMASLLEVAKNKTQDLVPAQRDSLLPVVQKLEALARTALEDLGG
jgi:hypothetical protein